MGQAVLKTPSLHRDDYVPRSVKLNKSRFMTHVAHHMWRYTFDSGIHLSVKM